MLVSLKQQKVLPLVKLWTFSCPAGKEATGGSSIEDNSSCKACDAGKFKAAEGTASCKAWTFSCPAGKEATGGSPIEDNSSCKACAAGTFKAKAGLDLCTACPQGQCPMPLRRLVKRINVPENSTSDMITTCKHCSQDSADL